MKPDNLLTRYLHHQEDNSDRWMVSYADFITLLLGFFIVMYSVSSLDGEKYQVISEALSQAFKPTTKAQASHRSLQESVLLTEPAKQNPETHTQEELAVLNQLTRNLQNTLSQLDERKSVRLRRQPNRVEIEIESQVLFQVGQADLSERSRTLLTRVATVLSTLNNRIHVEGFTDNTPILTSKFPSNWELSSARAASVVRFFARNGIAPERMAAVGYGEFRPVDDNATPEGRHRNRRVLIIIDANLAEPPLEVPKP